MYEIIDNYIVEQLTDKLIDEGVLDSTIDYEEVVAVERLPWGDEEYYTDEHWIDIDPLGYAEAVRAELFRRHRDGKIDTETLKEALETLDWEIALETKRKAKTDAIVGGIMSTIKKITKDAA